MAYRSESLETRTRLQSLDRHGEASPLRPSERGFLDGLRVVETPVADENATGSAKGVGDSCSRDTSLDAARGIALGIALGGLFWAILLASVAFLLAS